MLKSVGRRSPRQILRTRVSQAVLRPTGVARPTRSSSRVQTRLPASSPTAPLLLEPVYVSLSAPFKPKRTDPDPEETLVALDPTVFNHPIRRDILHLCVVQYRDSLRQGSANTKTRGEVRGSGRKIRPQKGTGKARLGDAQSPMLRGGGIAFGPKPRDFSTKLPRKVIQMGMRVALSTKVKEQQFGVMFSMDWPEPKTKTLAKRLEDLGLDQTLFVTGEEEIPVTLERAIRNIPKVKLTTSNTLTVHELLKWRRIMLDAKAVEFFERTLSRSSPTAEH
ncbi:ribosomal protein L4 domain-containing protein [Armillaria novae-zelandiae]|uniref:Large ribosomal subunit protein uL4m n=1 Tax=Armillaria novae-zelandiae TaxID=153914 RepID=A0AA39UDG9_9AGAR|nr:ribosomal protein L4 domain-containing protein [Armillaria novae-zelandiae]